MNILIVGKNSFIGKETHKYLESLGGMSIDRISYRDMGRLDGYDSVIYLPVVRKRSFIKKKLMYEVNAYQAEDTAKAAKAQGVKHFIYLSSMSVFGRHGRIGRMEVIKDASRTDPRSYYGKSKAEAEARVSALGDENFRVAVVRAPIVYGKGAKGNFARMGPFILKMPVFPYIHNARSMIYSGNLAVFISKLILNADAGIFHPQNDEYFDIYTYASLLYRIHGKKFRSSRFLGKLISAAGNSLMLTRKVFGSLVYDRALSAYKEDYCIYPFDESIDLTERPVNE